MSLKQFNNFINNVPAKGTVDFLHKKLGSQGVKVIHEKAPNFNDDTPKYARFMFTSFNRNNNFKYPGIVISDGKVVSVPQPPPCTKYSSKDLSNMLQQSNPNVYKARDGTIVTLYWYKSKWVIGTTRGYEVNDYKWMDTSTYQDTLDNVLSAHPDFSYDKLEKNKCYTIGFTHSDFHPFAYTDRKSHQSAWFVRSVDLDKFNNSDGTYISYEEDIGLPLQQRVKFGTVGKMFSEAKNAYKVFKTTGKTHFGHLVVTKEKCFLVESTLLRNIRQTFYNNKFSKVPKRFNRQRFIVVDSFLDPAKHQMFQTLFPHHSEQFIKLEETVDLLVEKLTHIVTLTNSKKKFVPVTDLDTCAVKLHKSITQELTINLYKKQDISNLLYTFVYDNQHARTVYDLAYTE
jgi:hypothetical protein